MHLDFSKLDKNQAKAILEKLQVKELIQICKQHKIYFDKTNKEYLVKRIVYYFYEFHEGHILLREFGSG
jgi:hypothetical protein